MVWFGDEPIDNGNVWNIVDENVSEINVDNENEDENMLWVMLRLIIEVKAMEKFNPNLGQYYDSKAVL